MPIKLVCFDVDQTILNGHLHSMLDKTEVPAGTATEKMTKDFIGISGGIKNKNALCATMRDLLRSGIHIALVSFTAYPETLPFVLRSVGLSKQDIEKIEYYTCAPDNTNRKNLLIQKAMKKYDIGENSEVVLIDDDGNNTNAAKKVGFQTITSPDREDEGNLEYLNILRDLCGLKHYEDTFLNKCRRLFAKKWNID